MLIPTYQCWPCIHLRPILADSDGRLFVMRSDESISEWETELSTTPCLFRGMPNPPEEYARVPGALFHMSQVTTPWPAGQCAASGRMAAGKMPGQGSKISCQGIDIETPGQHMMNPMPYHICLYITRCCVSRLHPQPQAQAMFLTVHCGALLHHLRRSLALCMQMLAFMRNASFVIVDTGPGSGPLFMNALMTSHGFLVPCGIDQKAKSMMNSLATKVRYHAGTAG